VLSQTKSCLCALQQLLGQNLLIILVARLFVLCLRKSASCCYSRPTRAPTYTTICLAEALFTQTGRHTAWQRSCAQHVLASLSYQVPLGVRQRSIRNDGDSSSLIWDPLMEEIPCSRWKEKFLTRGRLPCTAHRGGAELEILPPASLPNLMLSSPT
jgi:hypothetical protein